MCLWLNSNWPNLIVNSFIIKWAFISPTKYPIPILDHDQAIKN